MMSMVGILLAGGRSTRMGTDKAKLEIDHRRLVDVMLERLSDVVGDERVLVSGCRSDLRCVPDERPGLGPLEGVRSVISRLRSIGDLPREVLIVPVDMPLLTSAHLAQLLLGAIDTIDADAVFFDSFELPLLLRLNGKTLAELERLCQSDIPARARSFRSLLNALDVSRVKVDAMAAGFLLNANTPEEWRRIAR
jgi:molybdopterin-guanine dinucleotide biosynthesis protein A